MKTFDLDTHIDNQYITKFIGLADNTKWQLNRQVKNLRLLIDRQNDLFGFPVVVSGWATVGVSNQQAGYVPASVGGTFESDNTPEQQALYVNAQTMGYKGQNNWAKRRIADTFKNAKITSATTTALWTPTAGFKFNMLGGIVTVNGVSDSIQLQDNTTTFIDIETNGAYTVPIDFGERGFISAAANNVLNVVTSSNAAVGINVWGTEE